MAVHESLKLHITNDKFLIESQNRDANEILVIDRVSQEISLQTNSQIPVSAISKDIYGIFGVIRLVAGPYLVVITKRGKVGEIDGQPIWVVTGTEVLSYKRTTLHLTEQQVSNNKQYLSMLDHVLNVEKYYFSHTFDLTHTMQRLHNTSPDFVQMALHERADPRFVWNGHLLRELAQQPELSRFCLPIMLGFVIVKDAVVKGKSFKYIVVSRRSCFRAGVRYYMRGADLEGHVANYVETEQILEYEGHRCSFVQTRGSIPLFWSQRPNLKYKPDPELSEGLNQLDGFQRHFAAQVYNYGSQVLINLLDNKGKEKLLVQNYSDAVQKANNTNIVYEAFDFHHECRKMRWHRLSILVDRLADNQAKFGYFMMSRDGSVVSSQEGVFRTNCIDCLDRTNVVQSLLARKSLQAQLIKLGILQVGDQVEDQTHFEFIFKNVWADNADACAKQYAGTGALKTDYTRTGKRTIIGLLKDGVNASYRYFMNNFYDGFRQLLPGRHVFRTGARTKWGLLKDGYNSAVRYIMNNFHDGFRQDAIDLVLGNHIVEESEGIAKTSPLVHERDWKFYALPTIFIVAFSMAVISILIPDENPSEQIMYIFFWGSASFLSICAMYLYGDDFVNKPKLAQAKPKTE